MKQFETKEALVRAWAKEYVRKHPGEELEVAEITAKNQLAYAPHIYNAGHFIEGFGKSLDRLGFLMQGGLKVVDNL